MTLPRPAVRKHSLPSTGTFVVEKLSGSELQYDLLLIAGSVVHGWAVAGGPSTNPYERRSAVRLEDLPVDLYDFAEEEDWEEVLVWDRGRFFCQDPEGHPLPVRSGLEGGRLLLRLEGERFSGLYQLERLPSDDGGEDEEWLLVREEGGR